MKASTFAIAVILVYIGVLLIGYALVLDGAGLPGRFVGYYQLDGIQIMYGLARQSGSPLIYEWVVAGVLKPGNTTVNVGIESFDNLLCSNGTSPFELTVSVGDSSISQSSLNASITLYRQNALIISHVKVVVNTTMCRINPDQVYVYVEANVNEK